MSNFINNLLKSVEGLLSKNEALVNKSSDGIFHPGDIEIESITLQSRTQDKAFSLIDHAKVLDIYESVMSPVMFCEIGISDAIGLKNSFPILGGEYVTVTFKTPGNSQPSRYVFIVQSIADVKTISNNKLLSYTLKCVSAEILRNSNRHITRTTDGIITNAVEEILQDDLGTNKPLNLDKTQGIEKHTLTRMHPFVAIDYLRQRATSTKDKASAFVFYENKDGYRFTTIEKLMRDGKKSVVNSSKKFFYDAQRNDNVSDVSFRNILAYNQLVFNDVVNQAQRGGFCTRVKTFNLLTGEYIETKYDDSKGADQFEMSDEGGAPQTTPSNIKELSKYTPVSMFMAINSDISNDKIAEKLANSQAFAQKIVQNIVQIHVYGDSSVTVGDVIDCTFPSGTGLDTDSGVSRLDSGNYLVTRCRHIILNGDRPQHTMALECIKVGVTA